MSVKKFTLLIRPNFAIFCRKPLATFENRSRRARVDLNNIKLVLCMRNWFFEFIISLN